MPHLVSILVQNNGKHCYYICLCSGVLCLGQSLDRKQTTLSILVLSSNLDLVNNTTSLETRRKFRTGAVLLGKGTEDKSIVDPSQKL